MGGGRGEGGTLPTKCKALAKPVHICTYRCGHESGAIKSRGLTSGTFVRNLQINHLNSKVS